MTAKKPIKIYCTAMFVDLVNSSMHSKVLGIEDYAKRLQQFSDTMKTTYCEFLKHEPRPKVEEKMYRPGIDQRGDEAFILFSTDTSKPDNTDDVLTAIRLALQMKFAWKRRLVELDDSIEIKQHIELAVGINQGQMAAFTNDQEEIVGIEGYEINYAKRVESFSRIGKYTNIFLSEKTRNIFKNASMIFEKYEDCDLKGIDEHVNLYEIKEFLFQNMPLIYDDAMSQLFQRIRKNRLLASGKPWLEQYMINILFNTYCQKKLNHYKEKILEFINDSYHSDLLFYRFLKGFLLEDEFLFLKLQYYQEIVKERPSFILARLEIIRLYEHLCEKLNKIEPLALQVKNYIDEMMKFHPDLIEQTERETYGKILSRINSLIPS